MELELETVKYFFKESLSAGILVPLVWWYVKKETKTSERIVDAITEGFAKMEHAIVKHDEKMDREFVKQQLSLGSTALNEDQTVNLLLTNMWFVSYGKLQWIKTLLKTEYLDMSEETLRKNVKTELQGRSEEYLKEFRKYLTPVGDLSEWLSKEFDEKCFDEFVDAIIKIMHSTKYDHLDKTAKIELKSTEIATLMKEIQGKLANNLRKTIQSLS